MTSLESKRKSYFFGIIAEFVVIIYLFFTFHTVLARRYKTKLGEIDIIAKKGKQLLFIEVKARKDKDNNEVLSYNQKKRISDAANLFIQKNKAYSDMNYRFDLIIFNPPLTLRHIKNI